MNASDIRLPVGSRLLVVTCSTRPGRVGESVAAWFVDAAKRHGCFDVAPADLREVDLPFHDEPDHPVTGSYRHEHTRRWSEVVAASDAIVWVTPEYNHSFNAATKNAIDYLHHEWSDKAMGFVSYGGVSAGTRAVQALRPVLLAVQAVPVTQSVSVPFINNHVEDGRFTAPQGLNAAATTMLDELARREAALSLLRAQATSDLEVDDGRLVHP